MFSKTIKIFIVAVMGMVFCTTTAFCADVLDSAKTPTATNVAIPTAESDTVFKDRFVFFDKGVDDDENFLKLKKVIVKAKKLGFNALVLNQEYIYARLTHKNSIIDTVKKRYSEIEKLVHQEGMRLIVMHFNADVPSFVVRDGDPGNPFYTEGKFDFQEANKAQTRYVIKGGDRAFVDAKVQRVDSKELIDGLYHFKGIKPNTEYKLTLNATTKGFKDKRLKVSALDEDYSGENGKVLFGVQKHFRDIASDGKDRNYTFYFNSLNHKNLNGAIKIFLEKSDHLTVNYLELKEVGYIKSVHIQRPSTALFLQSADSNATYALNKDYRLKDDEILLLSTAIKKEKALLLTWYPRVDVSRFYGHETTADACADEKLFHTIMKDQYVRIKNVFNNKIDGFAINDDEWREAGWDENCKNLYAKEFADINVTRAFTGGDYIGITTKHMINAILRDENNSDIKSYVMSDMFDPNFNAKDPYMGVSNGAIGAVEYLPKETTVFNWFVNPYEPGLEDKTLDDFLKSAKHFASHGISQIIAGYHDDMKNLDANIDVYKESDKETQKSIVGFMFLIWHQDGKHATYDDMDKVVKRICQELPSKWPQEACK